jgi:RNA polymerase-binding transcription factor DksA
MHNDKAGHFKKRLTDELHKLEGELKDLGWQNPDTGDWEATGGDIDASATESDELADRQEEYGENRAEIEEIEIHWRNVKRALQKIEEGTFGICEISGDDIEEDRLEVNPSARTCKAHMEEEGELGA